MSEDQTVEPDRFWIKTLHLENFRRFEKLELGPFDPQFNLIVGENGAGKSSVLAALRYVCSQIEHFGDSVFPDIKESDVRRSPVDNDGNIHDIRVLPISINCISDFMSISQPFQIYYDRNPAHQDAWAGFKSIDGIAMHLRTVSEAQSYPISACYHAKRSFNIEKKKEVFEYLSGRVERSLAFKDWSNAGNSAESLFSWISWQSILKMQRQSRADIGKLDYLSIVIDSVSGCIGDLVLIEFDLEVRDVVIKFGNGRVLEFSTLSDGQKTYIAMVADIARRAIILNPHLGADAVKKTPGVILIDELDLHLHPRWQRTIIANLKKTFPLMQFFATTHSPIIIGEAKPEELVVLGEEGQIPVNESFGLSSDQVLEFIMGADARDPHVESAIRKMFDALRLRDVAAARSAIDDYKAMIDNARSTELVRAEALLQRILNENSRAAE